MNISPKDFKEKMLNNEHLPSVIVVKETIYCNDALIDSIPFEDLPLYINFNFQDHIHEHLTKRLQSKTA